MKGYKKKTTLVSIFKAIFERKQSKFIFIGPQTLSLRSKREEIYSFCHMYGSFICIPAIFIVIVPIRNVHVSFKRNVTLWFCEK